MLVPVLWANRLCLLGLVQPLMAVTVIRRPKYID